MAAKRPSPAPKPALTAAGIFSGIVESSKGGKAAPAGAPPNSASRDGNEAEGAAYAHYLQESIAAAQLKLRKVKAVNKQLHSALVHKKMITERLRRKNEAISAQIHYRQVEQPARNDGNAVLEDKIRNFRSQQVLSSVELNRSIMERKEQVNEIIAVIAQLKEENSRNRTIIRKQNKAVQDEEKRVRGLERDLEMMEFDMGRLPIVDEERAPSTRDSDVGSIVDMPIGGPGGALQRESTVATDASGVEANTGSPSGQRTSAEKYKQLPGLNLETLLGPDLGKPSKHRR